MRRWALVLFLTGITGVGFGWWGVFTEAGNRSFDEMDGILPAVSGLLGIVMLGVAVILGVVAFLRGRAA